MDPQFQQQNRNPFGPAAVPPKKGGWGAMLGIVIILILLVVAALYFWGEKLSKQQAVNEPTPQNTGATQSQGTNSTTNNDDLSSIEADLNSTDTASLDSGASELDGDINNL